MCGIIGILGEKQASPFLIDSLKRLEYRGYDSAGVATLDNGAIARVRAAGKLSYLEEKLQTSPLSGTIGIGHTRWATHGEPSEINAHPHATEKVAVVHNGIIENYAEIKAELQKNQVRFETDTDTEVIAHLVTEHLKQGLAPQEAANATFKRLKGAFSVVMIFAGEDNLMIGCRQGTPLAIGYGDGEMFLASDSYALAPMTKKICFMEDGDRVLVSRQGAKIYVNDNEEVEREIRITAQSNALTGKGEYDHFMLKEIHEQPAVIGDTLNAYIHPSTGHIAIPQDILDVLAKAPRITLSACGTAYYACLTAKYWFEKTARTPCEVDVASELRYREAPMPENGVAIVVSQSGETLDTLEALRYMKSQGQKVIAIVNTIESTIEREADFVLHTLAGPEIAVASTKATTCQMATLACIAVAHAHHKGVIDQAEGKNLAASLRTLPKEVARILTQEDEIKAIAQNMAKAVYALFLGRGGFYPIAMEGALKLKEISYIYAEGYAAGEMKHGPIALIDDTVPVIVLAPSHDPLFEKTVSNMQEVVARGGRVLMITDSKGREKLSGTVTWSFAVEDVENFIAPIVYTLPVQLLSYYVAVHKGTDVDQPRNLAKSVTVE